MLKSVAAAALAALFLLDAPAASAQSSDELAALRRQVEALKAGQDAVLKELQEIRALLRPRQAAQVPEPKDIVLGIDGAPFKGEPRARLVMVEFSDYQCPFCARYVRDTLPQLQRDYIDTGKLRYVARDFPLESIHPQPSRPPRPLSAPASSAPTGRCPTACSPTSARSAPQI